MSNEIIVKRKQMPKEEEIMEVYSGKPGCMCGCRGDYWSRSPEYQVNYKRGTPEGQRRIKMFPAMLKKVYRKLKDESKKGLVKTYRTGRDIVFYEDPDTNRSYVMYTKKFFNKIPYR
jgi:hypothetical protein